MPRLNLGRVVGRDGKFGNVSAQYVNDDGEPDVEINATGDDSAKEFEFIFKNLVNDPITSSEIEQVLNDQIINSSSTLTLTGLSILWARLKEKFAPKEHKHSAADITSGTLAIERIGNKSITGDKYADKSVGTAALADNAVGSDQLTQALRDSISWLSQRNIENVVFESVSDTSHAPAIKFTFADGTEVRLFVNENEFGYANLTSGIRRTVKLS